MAIQSAATTSPFLFLFRNAGPEVHAHLTSEQREDLTKKWNDWVSALLAQGKLQHGRPLGFGGKVISGARGQTVTDGPYAEATEAVVGYLFLSVAGLDEAVEVAKGCPGLPLGLTVEVRPVLDFSPVLEGVRGRAP